ncbi:unnamed protein product [Allacma fusca]|uniref:Uncharacterized protein n=1 Tax=Allacma fusca TaxID=39272 RepID=A0A8J2JHL5_9HEXA|nr:unnamed protein product [Allacma fusca]
MILRHYSDPHVTCRGGDDEHKNFKGVDHIAEPLIKELDNELSPDTFRCVLLQVQFSRFVCPKPEQSK